jgi:hypothetical protein
VPSLQLFQLLGGAVHVPASSAPAYAQRVSHALLLSLNASPLAPPPKPKPTTTNGSVDTSGKSKLLFEILLKLLDKVLLSSFFEHS